MSSATLVAIHASQFPENVRRDLLASLRTRRVNHKFHYDSVKQTQKWLALHERCSPARRDPDCLATYEQGFAAAAAKIKSARVHVIGLGCGGGQKDARLLQWLKASRREVFYTPCDVSPAMVLTARQAALAVVPEKNCFPFVCDLVNADDLPGALDQGVTHHASRITTFFGMIPNFEPHMILHRLASLVRPKDFLLFSANLAPGADYAAGMGKILPQYDNAPTRDWLLTFLFDLGVEPNDGRLLFEVEDGPAASKLKRIIARFHFKRARRIEIGSNQFAFRPDDTIQLFFSYRYTPERVRRVLGRHGLEVCGQWITKSEEEGVFLVRRGGVS